MSLQGMEWSPHSTTLVWAENDTVLLNGGFPTSLLIPLPDS